MTTTTTTKQKAIFLLSIHKITAHFVVLVLSLVCISLGGGGSSSSNKNSNNGQLRPPAVTCFTPSALPAYYVSTSRRFRRQRQRQHRRQIRNDRNPPACYSLLLLPPPRHHRSFPLQASSKSLSSPIIKPHVIVVGKIIIDEYGRPDLNNSKDTRDDDTADDPDDNDDDYDDGRVVVTTSIDTSTAATSTQSRTKNRNITVGGGGPQAALGAALALATWEYHYDYEQQQQQQQQERQKKKKRQDKPPKQPITLMAAVGGLDFGSDEYHALMNDLSDALQQERQHHDDVNVIVNATTSKLTTLPTPPGVVLLQGEDCITPKIRLWHEEDPSTKDQILKWFAVDDSFGDEQGAGKLWKIVPSIADYINLISTCTRTVNAIETETNVSRSTNLSPSYQSKDKSSSPTSGTIIKPILHVICEAGPSAPGGNGDSLPLIDESIRQSISFLGIEPILFPNDDDGQVGKEDAIHCSNLMQDILDGRCPQLDNPKTSPRGDGPVPVIICPDKATYQAMTKARCVPTTNEIPHHQSLSLSPSSILSLDSIVVREGPNGSTVHRPASKPIDKEQPHSSIHVPAATLDSLVNPTGAGNAYSAAFTALRGSGCDEITSACIATGVGAVFCEYDHCPPYTYDVLDRIHAASEEVRQRIQFDIS